MGRAPCCDKANVKKGPWSPEEDAKLKEYIEKQGSGGNWIALPKKAGLRRCGKSCRLRWLNYLRPNIKHGEFSDDEDRIICTLFASIGSRWSIIAAQLPGRTDNDIKNYWNTKLKKKLKGMAPSTLLQKKPHQTTTFPLPSTHDYLSKSSSLASPYASLLSQISSAYEGSNNSSYSNSVRAFSRFYESMSPSVLQAQDSYVYPMRGNHYNQMKHRNNNNNLLLFGGEPSCSSSDGSCTTNQISHCKVELSEHGGFYSTSENLLVQSYFGNGVDENQKFSIRTTPVDAYADEEKAAAKDCYSTNPLDYSIEEINQLISTNSICSSNLNFFLGHEIKTKGKN